MSAQISSHLMEDSPETFSEDDKIGNYLIKGKHTDAGYRAYLSEELSVIPLNQCDSH